MRVHYLQHVPFESIGSMENYFKNNNHRLRSTRLFLNEEFPDLGDFDFLIIMGGPMGVYDEDKFPWLAAEKLFIRSVMESGKTVLGICLGAQLIACSLGAKVYKNKHREIGWFPVYATGQSENTILQGVFPKDFNAFHWHGDTFDIPESGIQIASSKACKNQGFIIDDRIIGLQFHLETTPDSAKALITNCRDDLDGSEFVHSENEILNDRQRFSKINILMDSVLKRLKRI